MPFPSPFPAGVHNLPQPPDHLSLAKAFPEMSVHSSLQSIGKLESDLWEAADNLRRIAECNFLQRETLALQNQRLRAARDLLLPKPMSGVIEV